jgi:hypothetical protein
MGIDARFVNVEWICILARLSYGPFVQQGINELVPDVVLEDVGDQAPISQADEHPWDV